MRKIGLVGGMSWHSSLEYYRLINEAVNQRLGGLNSAEVFINSLNFSEIAELMDRDDWQEIAWILAQARSELDLVGTEIFLLCSNTIHHTIPLIRKFGNANFLHIAEVTADKVLSQKISKVALLGTKFTMTQDFYKESLKSRGLEVIIPDEPDMDFINQVIFEELCQGVVLEDSKRRLLEISGSLIERGAQGIILGCTELPLIIKMEGVSVPVFDTMKIHVEAAVDLALA